MRLWSSASGLRTMLAVVWVLLTVAAAGSAAPSGKPGARPDRHSEASPARLAVKGLDPVHLVSGKEVMGSGQFTAQLGPFHYHFATAANRKRFLADPARYAVQGDGHCIVSPVAMANPALFLVHQGKIYLFAEEHCLAAFRKDPEKFVKLPAGAPGHAAPHRRRNVAILIWSGAELLDFAGPAEAFFAADHGRAFRVYTVAVTTELVRTQGSVNVQPEFTLANCPKPDILIIPGGSTAPVTGDERTVQWVKKTAETAEIVLSICTGAFILAEAGLLDGKTATTHQRSIERLKQAAPNTTVIAERRYVDNGKIITSGGVSAGIDGALHVIARLLGREAAEWTAREWMEYPWSPGDR